MPTVIQVDTRACTDWLATLLGTGAEIADDSQGIMWLRTKSGDAKIESLIASVPGPRFEQCDGGWLIRPGDKVATNRLDPRLNWKRLDETLSVTLPVASLAGTMAGGAKIQLRLVRGGQPDAPTAAICQLTSLCRWARGASEVRLRRLRWVARENEALVMGHPLPPIVASYLVAKARILIPAGWQWMPHVPAEEVRKVFEVDEQQWIVWQDNGSWSVVRDDAFAAMRRASLKRARDELIKEALHESQ